MKVSVIVPVYNTERHLSKCLYSLINQSLQELEVIAVDDNSTDSSYKILKEFQRLYPNKIRVFHNIVNRGQAFSRNIGISIAKGEYIGFLDSDDYVNFEMYKSMYEGAKENGFPEVVVTGLLFVNNDYYLENGFDFLHRSAGKVYDVLKNCEFVLMNSPSVCNKIFRSDTVKDNNFLNGKNWEDVAFSYSKLFNASKVLCFNNPDYFYRRQLNSGVSSKGYNVNKNLLDIFDVADKIESDTRETGRFSMFESEIRFIQITACLQRIVEVFSWPIKEDDKETLISLMGKMILVKYGDWRKFPIEFVSSKVGCMELERINEIIKKQDMIENITYGMLSYKLKRIIKK